MTALSHWLDELGGAAEGAAAAEKSYRDDFARRVAELAETRAVAFRRANLMRAIAEAVARQDDVQAAVAHGLAVLRTRLGWSSDSEARAEILSRFAPVCEAAYGAAADQPPPHAEVLADGEPRSTQPVGASFEAPLRGAPQDEERGSVRRADPGHALEAFETWYVSAKGTPFWKLFENVMPETPLVDF